MIKIAVVLSGYPRIYQSTVDRLKNHTFKNFQVDFYCHFWYTNIDGLGSDKNTAIAAINYIKPKRYLIEEYHTVACNFIDHVRRTKWPEKYKNMDVLFGGEYIRVADYIFPGQFISRSKSMKLVEGNYDIVFVTRSDIVIEFHRTFDHLLIKELEENTLYESASIRIHQGVPVVTGDMCFVSDLNSAHKYFCSAEESLYQLFNEYKEFLYEWLYYWSTPNKPEPLTGIAHWIWGKIALINIVSIKSKKLGHPEVLLTRKEVNNLDFSTIKIQNNYHATGHNVYNKTKSSDFIDRTGKIIKKE